MPSTFERGSPSLKSATVASVWRADSGTGPGCCFDLGSKEAHLLHHPAAINRTKRCQIERQRVAAEPDVVAPAKVVLAQGSQPVLHP